MQQPFGPGGAGYDKFYCFLSVSQVKTLEVCIILRPCCMQLYIQQVVSMVYKRVAYMVDPGSTECMEVAVCRETCMKEGQCCVISFW